MIQIKYSNDKSILPYYVAGTDGKIYLDVSMSETEYDIYTEGYENGEFTFIPVWQRGVKKYVINTMLLPMHTVELIYRLPLMNKVTVIEKSTYYNAKRITVTHEYPFDNMLLAQVRIAFDTGEIITKKYCN